MLTSTRSPLALNTAPMIHSCRPNRASTSNKALDSAGLHARPGRAWRLRTDFYASNWPVAMATPWHAAIQTIANSDAIVHCIDRRLRPQQQDVQAQVGDFVRQRALGLATPL